MEPSSHDVSHLLRQMRGGDKEAENRFGTACTPNFIVWPKAIAGTNVPITLSPTALVHEAYLRLVAQRDKTWQNKLHFIGVAAQVMRRVLVDHARHYRVGKRAGAHARIGLDEQFVAATAPAENIVALDEALADLEKFDPQQSRVVELRFFGGLQKRKRRKSWALVCALLHES